MVSHDEILAILLTIDSKYCNNADIIIISFHEILYNAIIVFSLYFSFVLHNTKLSQSLLHNKCMQKETMYKMSWGITNISEEFHLLIHLYNNSIKNDSDPPFIKVAVT